MQSSNATSLPLAPAPAKPDAPGTPGLRSTVCWLLAVSAVTISLRLWIFNGLGGHDDWVYLFYTRSFLNGDTHELLTSLWGLRWGIWLPIALLFKIFGVHYWLAFAPGFALGLGSVLLAYWITFQLTHDFRAARWASLFLMINPVDWFVSTTIRGDIEVSFYGGLILLCLLSMEACRKVNPYRAFGLGVVTGIVWGVAALTKEWAFVFAWGFCGLLVWRTFQERAVPWLYASILLGFFAMLALDGGFLYLTTGHALQRFQQSISWYEHVRQEGGYVNDLSLSYAYLPSLLLNLNNSFSAVGRFVNGYPRYGWYFLVFFATLAWGLWRLCGRKTPLSTLLCFLIGTSLWIEFGSMSMTAYTPYHKEPRYLTILSVPIACFTGWALQSLWGYLRPWLRVPLTLSLAALALSVAWSLKAEHLEYISGRDFLPGLVHWLGAHPESRLWATATIQQDIDLQFGYRFADPVHRHKGQPGFGAIQDIGFLQQAKPGDLILITPRSQEAIGPQFTPQNWERIEEFRGFRDQATLFRMN